MDFKFKSGNFIDASNNTTNLNAPPIELDSLSVLDFENEQGIGCILTGQMNQNGNAFVQHSNVFMLMFISPQDSTNANEQPKDSTQQNKDTTAQTNVFNFKAYEYTTEQPNTNNWAALTDYNGTTTIDIRKKKLTIYNKANDSTVYFTMYKQDSLTTDSAGNTFYQWACIDDEGNYCYVRLVLHHTMDWQLYIYYDSICEMFALKMEE